jgi:hypothetical protein
MKQFDPVANHQKTDLFSPTGTQHLILDILNEM